MILFHLGFPQQDPLYHSLTDRSVLHQRHLLVVVEQQRVEPLTHKEMFHLPLALFHQLSLLPLNQLEWEDDTLLLELLVGQEVEQEVIKHGISSSWHRCLCYQQLHRVYRLS